MEKNIPPPDLLSPKNFPDTFQTLVSFVRHRFQKDRRGLFTLHELNDIAQEIMIQYHIHKETITINNHWNWLKVVARNKALDYIRNLKQEKVAFSEFAVLSHTGNRFLFQETIYVDKQAPIPELWEEIRKKLSVQQMNCIEDFYLRSLSYQEISSVRGYSEKQVKTYIQNGRRLIKESFGLEDGNIYILKKHKKNSEKPITISKFTLLESLQYLKNDFIKKNTLHKSLTEKRCARLYVLLYKMFRKENIKKKDYEFLKSIARGLKPVLSSKIEVLKIFINQQIEAYEKQQTS